MSRHRNVRSMNYEDEYYDEDDVYGHSVEDNYCISPGTAAQFTFNRDHNVALSSFMDKQGGIPEEDEEDLEEGNHSDNHRSSLDYTRPKLNDVDEAKLNSALEEVCNVLGESVPEHVMVDTILKHNFSVEGSLNELLDAPKKQREPRKNRRNRSQEFDFESDDLSEYSESPPVFVYDTNLLSGMLKFGDKVSPKSNSFSPKQSHMAAAINKDQESGKSPLSPRQSANMDEPPGVSKSTHQSIGKLLLDESRKSNKDGETKPSVNLNQSKEEKVYKLAADGQNVGVNLQQLAKQKQNTGTKLSELAKASQAGGVQLSALAQANQNKGSKLSELAKSNQTEESNSSKMLNDSQSANTKSSDVFNNTKLSDLAKLNQSGGVSLFQLAKANQEGGIKFPVHMREIKDKDSNTHNDGNKSGTTFSLTLSDLSKAQCGQSSQCSKDTSVKTEKLSLSSLAKSHLESSPVSPVSSKISGSTSTSPKVSCLSNSSSLLTVPPKSSSSLGSTISLSMLSRPANSSSPSSSSSPLSQLAKQDNEYTRQSVPIAMQPGLSLAQLAAVHGVKQSPPVSLTSLKDNKENVHQGTVQFIPPDLMKNKSDKEQIMLSLSSLIAGKKSSQTNQPNLVVKPSVDIGRNSEQAKMPTLMDLAKIPKVHTQKKLTDDTQSSQTKKLGAVELDDSVDSTQGPGSKLSVVESANESTGNWLDNLLLNQDISVESLKFLTEKPSVLGFSLCLSSNGKIIERKKYKSKYFSYKYQMKVTKSQPCEKLNKVTPFDFSDPSPDDIVKSKQKHAFRN